MPWSRSGLVFKAEPATPERLLLYCRTISASTAHGPLNFQKAVTSGNSGTRRFTHDTPIQVLFEVNPPHQFSTYENKEAIGLFQILKRSLSRRVDFSRQFWLAVNKWFGGEIPALSGFTLGSIPSPAPRTLNSTGTGLREQGRGFRGWGFEICWL